MPADPFVRAAKAETMLRDFDRLRRAIRAHDSEAAEAAWDKCERWVGCIDPNAKRPPVEQDRRARHTEQP